MFSSGRGLLVSVSVSACVVIYAVHYQQTRDRTEMHKGVLRDMERRLAAKRKAGAKSESA
jgi:hypothetical protein